jgi:uroporphyrin-III C-methyltransferase
MDALLRDLPALEPGSVWLAGAGPGDPGLLSVLALHALRQAEVVVYDALVDKRILDLARPGALLEYAGKRGGKPSARQRDISLRLIELAREGKRVLRLKGGDPFVFGRGGEELEALRSAGVEAHVVPGVSAALGCAASAGLPLTHRDHAHAVTFVTGRGKGGTQAPDLTGLAGPGRTLAVYMGRDCAAAIAEALLVEGLEAATPVAIIENGTLPGERILKGRLWELAELALQTDPDAPALLFVGETAALAAARTRAEAIVAEAAA